jgi:3-oxoacyl-[acyl-carrier-protein] synthase II
MNKCRVVITGMGIINAFDENALCTTKEKYWESISAGKNAVRAWRPEDTDDFPVKYAATINFDLFKKEYQTSLKDAPLLERRGYFGLVAANNAFKDARLTSSMHIGCAACSGVPEIHESEMLALGSADNYPESLEEHRTDKPSEQLPELSHSGLASTNDRMVSAIAESLSMTGPVININGACAGAAQAIGVAYRAIQRGEADVMLAGGADSVTNTRVMSGLYLLGATATSSPKKEALCCPFDQGRSGLVAGEGGAFLVLESEASAKGRDALIYGEIVGYGSSLDAYKVTAPHPEGKGAEAAIVSALKDANLSPEKIDYINAHGTSTPMNDVVETQTIKKVFAKKNSAAYPLISSTKSMIGHWISAAAAPEAIATVMAIYHGIVPPTINLNIPDVDCDLDYVPNQAREKKMHYAMSNSFGFGGINASIIIKAYK